MARNDGTDRTFARNRDLSNGAVDYAQAHNEREKTSYQNPDIVPEQTCYNVHFKQPEGSYEAQFKQMQQAGMISTRGLKPDAVHYCELLFDVNSAYFYNHGGYEFAKQFYAHAYQAAIHIVGGEQYILSAVMHADERNRAMSEALGQDVFHYHLHVVYVPVVEKQILWTKRCKNKDLVGTVKETVMQVSRSKKWASKPALDEAGNPILTAKGKAVLRPSYSVLQDEFHRLMVEAGYSDLERGERGSTEEHLTVTQFKVKKEQERLAQLEQNVEQEKQVLIQLKGQAQEQRKISATFADIDSTGNRGLFGKVTLTVKEAEELKTMAKSGISAQAEVVHLREQLHHAQREVSRWREAYYSLYEQTREFLEAIKYAPERLTRLIRETIREVLLTARREREQPQQNRCRSHMKKSSPRERDEAR